MTRTHVAAFDFDGTLAEGGSVWRFLVATVGLHRVLLGAAPLLGKLIVGAVAGGEAADVAKEALFRRTLKGIPLEELSVRATAFGLEHYRRRARPDVRERLEWHRSRGHRLVIVSASPELYVNPVGDELRVDAVLATHLEVTADGRLTGGFEGKNCRGPEKLERLERWMAASGLRPFLWAYGNSSGDYPLLSAADVGVDVGRLGRLGRLRAFTRLGSVAEGPEEGAGDLEGEGAAGAS